MRISLAIPPAAALFVVLSWNLAEWRKVSEQQARSEDLRRRLELEQVNGEAGRSADRPTGAQLLDADGRMDWDEFSTRLAAIRGGHGSSDMQALKKQLSAMSREEIIAALEQISAMGLSEEEMRPLEEFFIGSLAEIDPEAALDRFSDHIRDGSLESRGHLAKALQAWAKKDPRAASSWLDRQIQSGLFDSLALDGRNEARLQFEASLVGELLTSDPAAAGMRIAALPEEQRREVLEPIPFADLSDAAQQAYVELVRELVPKDENAGSLVHIVVELVPEGGYDKVDAFLDRIDASDEERAVSARQAASTQLGELASERPLVRQDIEDMRSWLKTHSPGDVDTVTGRALGEVVQDGGKLSFQEASDMVLNYQKSSGSDDVLVAFLRSFAARSNLERATSLAAMIKDPALRQKILNEIH